MSTFVDEVIKSHKVTVFSKTNCPYCVKAKNVLKKYNPNDVYIVELDNRDDANTIQDYLGSLTGARTVSIKFHQVKIIFFYLFCDLIAFFLFKKKVPRVFIGGQFIGGGDDTARMDKENKLKPMLENAGAL